MPEGLAVTQTPRRHWPEYLIEGWAFGHVHGVRLGRQHADSAPGRTSFVRRAGGQVELRSHWHLSGDHCRGSQRDGWRFTPLRLAMSPRILQAPVEAVRFDGFASAANVNGEAESRLPARIATLPGVKVRARSEVASIMSTGTAGAGVASVRLASGEEIVLFRASAPHSPRLLQPFIASWSSGGPPAAHTIGSNLKLYLLTRR